MYKTTIQEEMSRKVGDPPPQFFLFFFTPANMGVDITVCGCYAKVLFEIVLRHIYIYIYPVRKKKQVHYNWYPLAPLKILSSF